MKLRIISGELEIAESNVYSVRLPGAGGTMEILPGHAKLVSILKEGEIEYIDANGLQRTAIMSGIVEVSGDHITAVVET